MEEKAVVKIGAEGIPVECAKGAELSECGYKSGAKVCGKCGAMAVQVKENMEEDEEEIDEEEMMEETPVNKPSMRRPVVMSSEDEMMEEDPSGARERLRMAGRSRMESMGAKSAEYDDGAFICGFEREVKSAGSTICASCPGGCQPEQDLPTLLEVEGLAEKTFEGKVTDSGYSTEHDIFLVAMERKSDGESIVVLFDGSNADCVGWRKKDIGFNHEEVIGFNEAKEIAMKSIDSGEFVDIETDIFDGEDAYVVNVKTGETESVDVYVSLKGEILSQESLDYSEAAEIALKSMYGEEDRTQMAEEGMALPDGSFPIKDVSDLKNAIMAYGRAKDKAAAKAHIMKRAKELESEDLIPESWSQKSAEEAAFLADLMDFELLAAEENI